MKQRTRNQSTKKPAANTRTAATRKTTTKKKTAARSASRGSSADQQAEAAEVAVVRALSEAMQSFGLAEIEYSTADLDLVLRRNGTASGAIHGAAATVSLPAAAPAPDAAAALPAPGAPGTEARSDSYISVSSPFVGTFYRSPSPDAEAFVEVGDSVKKGQVLCIVEAMKLMNEIEAEVAGTVVSVQVENAHAVEYGQTLFKLNPA